MSQVLLTAMPNINLLGVVIANADCIDFCGDADCLAGHELFRPYRHAGRVEFLAERSAGVL